MALGWLPQQEPGIIVYPRTKLPQAKIPSVPAYNVAGGRSCWSLRGSDAGGSTRSYRNGRV